MVEHDENLDILHGLAERIRLVRGNMSRADFAKTIGVHLNTVGYYERNQRTPDALVLIKICSKFAIKPEWLLFGEGSVLDESKIEIESAQAGTLCAGQPLAKVVVKSNTRAKSSASQDHSDLYSADTIKMAIKLTEQALIDSNKSINPEKKSALILAVCDVLIDGNKENSVDNVIKLIRLSA